MGGDFYRTLAWPVVLGCCRSRMSSDQEDFDVGNTEIAEEVYKGIDDDGFDNSAVEALLQLVRTEGQIDMLGDVLIHLARRQHPDWAAEICRWGSRALTAPCGRACAPPCKCAACGFLPLVS